MTVDVSAFRRQSDGTVIHLLADKNSSGATVTGIEKLAQRFVLKLMMRKGSIPYKPNEGTMFVELLLNGRASTELDVFTIFAAALADITTTITAEEQTTDPSEEKFKSALLKKIIIQPGKLAIDVEVKSQAGEVLNLRLPLAFTLG